jgi:hypothetical protein
MERTPGRRSRLAWHSVNILVGQEPLRQRRKRDATDTQFLQGGEQAVLNPTIQHGVGRLVNEQGHSFALQDFRRLSRPFGTV